MDLNIYISTCNTHIHLMKPFSYLFNKFWSPNQKVNVLCYDLPNFDTQANFNYISMGKSTGNSKEWAGDLHNFFKSVDDKHLIFGLEDFFICQPVDIQMIEKLQTYTEDKAVARISLTHHLRKRPYDLIYADGDYRVIESHSYTDYRVSSQFAIWQNEYFTHYLSQGGSIWDWEMGSLDPARTDGYRVLGTVEKFAIYIATGVRKPTPGEPVNVNDIDWTCDIDLGEPDKNLDVEIIEDMRKKGFI